MQRFSLHHNYWFILLWSSFWWSRNSFSFLESYLMMPVNIERHVSEFMIMLCIRKLVNGVSAWFTFSSHNYFPKRALVTLFKNRKVKSQFLVNSSWSLWFIRKGRGECTPWLLKHWWFDDFSIDDFRNSHCTAQQPPPQVSVSSLAPRPPPPAPSMLMPNKSWHLFLLSTGGPLLMLLQQPQAQYQGGVENEVEGPLAFLSQEVEVLG